MLRLLLTDQRSTGRSSRERPRGLGAEGWDRLTDAVDLCTYARVQHCL
ncbi:hypothetical protein OG342_01255 [Streptomyces bobili]|nr:hypothetical protein [Streptomyces bobili]MCX5521515.1 hypothetical protein [Streptomyces bobili]